MPSPDGERGLARERTGLARERTGLAWERSALGYGALGALLVGAAAHRGVPGLLILGLALFAVAVLVWRHGHRSYGHDAVAPQARALGLMALATALTAVAAAIIVVAS